MTALKTWRVRADTVTVKKGLKFGNLTVSRRGNTINAKSGWVCHCICGVTARYDESELLTVGTISCGCLKTSARIHVQVGNVFSRLTVIGESAAAKGRRRWRCQCSCTKIRVVSTRDLTSGKVKSCGCYRRNDNPLNLVVDGQLREILDGALLSDGSFVRTPSSRGVRDGLTAHFSCAQSARYPDRIEWLQHMQHGLERKNVVSKIYYRRTPPRVRIDPVTERSFVDHGMNTLRTPNYPWLLDEFQRWYSTGIKRVPADLVLTPLVVAYWFAGDGGRISGGALAFSTDGFIESDTRRLCKMLCDLGVEATVFHGQKHREGTGYRIRIPHRTVNVFRQFITLHLPQCFQYKLRQFTSEEACTEREKKNDLRRARRKARKEGRYVDLRLRKNHALPQTRQHK